MTRLDAGFFLEKYMRLVRRPPDGSDPIGDLRAQLEAVISELIAQANEAGFSTRETVDVLIKLIRQQQQSLKEDPDPVADPG